MSRAERNVYPRLYRRLCQRGPTVNRLNRLHIALDNRMTPLEAMALHEALLARPGWRSGWSFLPVKLMARARQRVAGLFGALGRRADRAYAQRRWIRKLHVMLARSGKPAPEPFVRSRLASDVALYSAGGERKAKTLAICFTGSSHRLLMPISVFLQHLDAATTDLVLVKYPRGQGFSGGMPQLAGSFAATVDALARLTRPGDYRRTVTLGTSGGGLAALLTAARLGLAAALSVSGKGPDDPRWQAGLGSAAGADLQRYLGERPARPELFLVFGRDHARDKEAAQAMARAVPARLIEVTNPGGTVGHNSLFAPLMRGGLRALLDDSILASPKS